MGVQPISERGRRIVLALARHRSPVLVADLAQELPMLGRIDDDVAGLIHGGTLVAHPTMDAAQLKAELDEAWKGLVHAQRTGATFTWRTRNRFRVQLSAVGRDMVPLLAKPRV